MIDERDEFQRQGHRMAQHSGSPRISKGILPKTDAGTAVNAKHAAEVGRFLINRPVVSWPR